MTPRLLRAFAWLLPLGALIYLGLAFSRLDPIALAGYLNSRVLGIACIVALLYGAGLYILAFAWSASLQRFSQNRVSPEAAVQLYAFDAFAKYLPGNRFHYADRQIAAERLGYGQKAPRQATLLEVLGHLAAICVILLMLLPFMLPGLLELHASAAAGLSSWIFYGLISLAASMLFLRLWSGARPLPHPLDVRLLMFIALLQVSFFLLVALLGLWLAIPILHLTREAIPLLVLIYLSSWLVGFVVPGAPGGLGLREACLLAGLSGLANPEAVLAFTVLIRVALLIGEALFSLSGFLFRPGQEVDTRSHTSLTAR